jgi:hypothetical protein
MRGGDAARDTLRLPKLFNALRLSSVSGCGASLIAVKLMVGSVFDTWAVISLGKYRSPWSRKTKGAPPSQFRTKDGQVKREEIWRYRI